MNYKFFYSVQTQLNVSVFEDYANGLQITHTLENKTLYFNARNDNNRTKFVDDLREAIYEVIL